MEAIKHNSFVETDNFLSQKVMSNMRLSDPQPINITFNSSVTGKPIGVLKEVNGKLTFEGDVDEAGKIFVDFICKSFNERIKNERKELEQAVLACEKVIGKVKFRLSDDRKAYDLLNKALEIIKQ